MQHLFWKLKELPTAVEKILHYMSNVSCNWKRCPPEWRSKENTLWIHNFVL